MTLSQKRKIWVLIILFFILMLFRCGTVSRLSKEEFKPRIYHSVHTQKFYTTKDGDWGVAMFTDTTTIYASVSLWIIRYKDIDTPYPITYVRDFRIFSGDWGKITLNEMNNFIIVELKSQGAYHVDMFIEQIY